MNIEVTVGEVDLSTVIGEHRVYHLGDDEYERQPMTVADAIVKELVDRLVKTDSYTSLRDQVRSARDEVIRELIRPTIEATIATPVQPTNGFGEPQGEPTTLTSLIMDEVRSYLGKGTGTYRNESTMVKDFIRTEVDRAIKKELAEVMAEEKAKVVEAVRASAATLIADAVKNGLGGR